MGLAPNPQSKLTRSSTKIWLVLQLLDVLQFLCTAVSVLHLSTSGHETKGTLRVRQEKPVYQCTTSKLIIPLLQSRAVQLSNDVSCSVFGLAVFVTLSYYYLLLTGQIEDSDKVKQFLQPVQTQSYAADTDNASNNITGSSMDIACLTYWQRDSSST